MKKVYILILSVTAAGLIGCYEIYTGTVSITSVPQGAEVYLDDSLTGQTTDCLLEEVTVNEYEVKLRLDSYLDYIDTVEVELDDTVYVEADLDALGVLTVQSVPTGADVYVNDSPTGLFTDCVLVDLYPGEYEITVKLEGHIDAYTFVNLQPDYNDTIHFALQEEVEIVWRYETTEPITTSPAIGYDGTIYLSNGDLYALNPDGYLKWQYIGRFSAPVVAANGTIHSGFKAINPDGSYKWEYEPDSFLWCRDGSTCGIAADGTIYVASFTTRDNNVFYLFALDQNGDLEWLYADTVSEEIKSVTGPVIGTDGTIYSSASGNTGSFGNLYAVEPDGSLSWRYELDNPVTSTPALGSDGTLYFVSGEFLLALGSDNNLLWSFETGGGNSSPAIGADGTLYVGGYDATSSTGYMYAICPDGTLKWGFPTDKGGGAINSSPAIDAAGNIYFGASGKTYSLRPDGTLRWKVNTAGSWSNASSPAIKDDGVLFIGDRNGTIYAIKTGDYGLASSTWPKFRANNQNTGRIQ